MHRRRKSGQIASSGLQRVVREKFKLYIFFRDELRENGKREKVEIWQGEMLRMGANIRGAQKCESRNIK